MNPIEEPMSFLYQSPENWLDPQVGASFRQHLARLPESFLAIDLFMTGQDNNDLIVRVCLQRFDPSQPVGTFDAILNWSDPECGVDLRWLKQRIPKNDKFHGLTFATMCRMGKHPMEVLRECRAVIRNLPPGTPLVGHSLYHFKIGRLIAHCRKWLGDDSLDRDSMLIWDTGLFHEGLLMRIGLRPGETLAEYYARVIECRDPGYKWLLGHCLEYYGIERQFSYDDPTVRMRTVNQMYLRQRQALGI